MGSGGYRGLGTENPQWNSGVERSGDMDQEARYTQSVADKRIFHAV